MRRGDNVKVKDPNNEDVQQDLWGKEGTIVGIIEDDAKDPLLDVLIIGVGIIEFYGSELERI